MEKREVQAFWRRLSEALSKGKPLGEALEQVTALPEVDCIAEPLEAMIAAVKGGTPLHQALRDQPSICTETMATIVQANEGVPHLSQAAKLLADAVREWWFPSEPCTKDHADDAQWAQRAFWRELDLLVRTRVPLVRALHCIERDLGDHPFAELVREMAGRVESGDRLSGALDAQPQVFASRARSLVHAAEKGGVLDQATWWIAKDLEQRRDWTGEDEPDEPVAVTDSAECEHAHALFWCQFGRLLRCGTPVQDAFLTAAWDSKNKRLFESAKLVVDDIQGGAGLAEGMRRRPREFTKPEWQKIAEGEREGEVDRAALELAGRVDELDHAPQSEGGQDETVEDALQEFHHVRRDRAGRERIDLESMEEMKNIAPVRKLLNLVLLQAIKDQASDIHFECHEDTFTIRYRIDGILYEMFPPPIHLALAIISRIKVMAGLDITEQRRAQRGRVELNVDGNRIDLLVDIVPCVYGERCSLRVCDEKQTEALLSEIDLPPEALATMKTWCGKSSGLVLIGGPAGSGKTTTLYAMVNELKRPSRAIISVEDPIVGKLQGVAQVQISPGRGFGRHQAIEAAMRQACDVLVLGDLPDLESAMAACQAALQGRLVLATLPANESPSAIRRLLDMGCTPYLAASALLGVSCQRLVRKLCDCKKRVTPDEIPAEQREFLASTDLAHVYEPHGCDTCHKQGYRGRVPIYELLDLDAATCGAIAKDATTDDIRQLALKTGMQTLHEAAVEVVKAGTSSVNEIMQALAS